MTKLHESRMRWLDDDLGLEQTRHGYYVCCAAEKQFPDAFWTIEVTHNSITIVVPEGEELMRYKASVQDDENGGTGVMIEGVERTKRPPVKISDEEMGDDEGPVFIALSPNYAFGVMGRRDKVGDLCFTIFLDFSNFMKKHTFEEACQQLKDLHSEVVTGPEAEDFLARLENPSPEEEQRLRVQYRRHEAKMRRLRDRMCDEQP